MDADATRIRTNCAASESNAAYSMRKTEDDSLNSKNQFSSFYFFQGIGDQRKSLENIFRAINLLRQLLA